MDFSPWECVILQPQPFAGLIRETFFGGIMVHSSSNIQGMIGI
jgi:hypothetical protein